MTQPATIEQRSDGGSTYVPVQTRSERLRSFDVDSFEAITGREVDWKFTPIQRMGSVLDDRPTDDRQGDPAVDCDVDAPAGVVVGTLAAGEAPRGDVLVPEDRPSAIASRNTTDALHLRIEADAVLERPARVRVIGRGTERRGNAHIVIEAMAHSSGTVVLEHTGSASLAENVEIIVRDGARLNVIALQDWAGDAVHVGAHQADVARDAVFRHVLLNLGGSIVRVNPSVRLSGQGADAELTGLYFADAGQHLEQQVFAHHDAPQTRSRVNYKGVLQGASARTVWIGDVLIGRTASGTDSYEQNRNLMLTDGTRADSIPNLEIETGDIVGAGHASATGRFDEEQLFYLRARGIRETDARRLVVRGFLDEIVQKVGDPELEERLNATIERSLAATDAEAAEIGDTGERMTMKDSGIAIEPATAEPGEER